MGQCFGHNDLRRTVEYEQQVQQLDRKILGERATIEELRRQPHSRDSIQKAMERLEILEGTKNNVKMKETTRIVAPILNRGQSSTVDPSKHVQSEMDVETIYEILNIRKSVGYTAPSSRVKVEEEEVTGVAAPMDAAVERPTKQTKARPSSRTTEHSPSSLELVSN